MDIKEFADILQQELPGFNIKVHNQSDLSVEIALKDLTDIPVLKVWFWDASDDRTNLMWLNTLALDRGYCEYINQHFRSQDYVITIVEDFKEGWLKLKTYTDNFSIDTAVSTLTDLGFTWNIERNPSSPVYVYPWCYLKVPDSDLNIDIRMFWVDPYGVLYLYHSIIREDLNTVGLLFDSSLDKLINRIVE